MIDDTRTSTVIHYCHSTCISWSAIFVGALVGIGLSFLLNLFGIAIGLAAFTTNANGITSLAIGGFLGMLIGGIATMFFSGWVAGYLGRTNCHNRHLGALYGFATWCLIVVAALLLIANTNAFIHYHSNAMSNSAARATDIATNKVIPTTLNQINSDEANQHAVTRNPTVLETKEANNLGISLFLSFILFFIGAVAASFGGYFGLKPKNDTIAL